MHNIIPFVKYFAQKTAFLILATKSRSHEGKEEKWPQKSTKYTKEKEDGPVKTYFLLLTSFKN
jgi:hypothetical protein